MIAALSTGAQPGTTDYTSAQWNGGDALAALGLSQLGARIYDPVIGRFLSRDPLLIPRTAATTNPYAFANNDPVNSSDPTGLCSGPEIACVPPPMFDPFPGLPGFFGGGSGHDASPSSKPKPINGTVVSTKIGSGANGFPVTPLGQDVGDTASSDWTLFDQFTGGIRHVRDIPSLRDGYAEKYADQIAKGTDPVSRYVKDLALKAGKSVAPRNGWEVLESKLDEALFALSAILGPEAAVAGKAATARIGILFKAEGQAARAITVEGGEAFYFSTGNANRVPGAVQKVSDIWYKIYGVQQRTVGPVHRGWIIKQLPEAPQLVPNFALSPNVRIVATMSSPEQVNAFLKSLGVVVRQIR